MHLATIPVQIASSTYEREFYGKADGLSIQQHLLNQRSAAREQAGYKETSPQDREDFLKIAAALELLAERIDINWGRIRMG